MPGLELEISLARAEEREAIANMMQLYVHDFSEQWSGTPRGELGDDGRFEEYPLEPYWREADHVPLLLRVDGALAGFALLDAASHTGRRVERNMAEFFVVRKHRRGGLGTAAARAIFARYPGQWETAVARRNAGALAFWRRAVGEDPAASGVEEVDVADEHWNGPVLRFRIAGAWGAPHAPAASLGDRA